MKQHRHRHPHVDIRKPRDGQRCRVNPPAFVWRPLDGADRYRVQVGRSADLTRPVIEVEVTSRPLFIPRRRLEPGRYFWRWSAGRQQSEVFGFEVAADAAELLVPSQAELSRRIPTGHPRMLIRPEEVEALRRSRHQMRRGPFGQLVTAADAILAEPHEMPEPPFLPDRGRDYQRYFAIWHEILRRSRAFASGAETLALAYLASGDRRYGQAAVRRLVSLSAWDPQGSSHIDHNDEAHMPVMWWGPFAYDYVAELMSPSERAAVVEHLRRRAEITYHHCRNPEYGIERFDSHAGRLCMFVGHVALACWGEIGQAGEWLGWLLPMLVGIWPIWGGDAGGWAQGITYSTAYVGIALPFLAALKTACGLDLFVKPFFANHGRWRQMVLPPYAEWVGFGDGSERTQGLWFGNQMIVEYLARATGRDELLAYASQVAAERFDQPDPSAPGNPQPPLRYLQLPPRPEAQSALQPGPAAELFEDVGWAAVRTDLADPQRDVALIFRSSPYGSVSHSHANNNAFILHVGGRAVAVSSGYYDGYGSAHHYNWTRQSFAHNTVTIDGAGQLNYSHDSGGFVDSLWRDSRCCYFRGDAGRSYGADRVARYRRHVLFFFDRPWFVLLDELELVWPATVQWHVHSFEPIEADESGRRVRLRRGQAGAEVALLYHLDGYARTWEGFDPPPSVRDPAWRQRYYKNQYHYRFGTGHSAKTHRIAAVFVPTARRIGPAPPIKTSMDGRTEIARLRWPDRRELLLVGHGQAIDAMDFASDALLLHASMDADGQPWQIDLIEGQHVRWRGQAPTCPVTLLPADRR